MSADIEVIRARLAALRARCERLAAVVRVLVTRYDQRWWQTAMMLHNDADDVEADRKIANALAVLHPGDTEEAK